MNKKIVALVVILVIAGGAVGAYVLLGGLPSGENTIVVGTTDAVEASIDPAQSWDYFGWSMISCLGAGLVEIIPGTSARSEDIRGALAESWHVSDDGKTWTFDLRQGLTFADGTPFNATVVKYSFDRNMGMALPDGPQVGIGYGDIIDSVTVVDTYTVKFDLKISFAPFLQLMACAASYMVHPKYAPLDHYVGYNASKSVRECHPNGLGPFTLTKWTREGGEDVMMRLEKNPNYWNSSLPKVDVIIKFYSSEAALYNALTTGEIDVAYRHLTPDQLNELKGNSQFKVWEGIGAAIQYLCFQQRIYPLNITEVRRAIAAAINRTAVAETVFHGTVDPLYSIIPAGMAYHKPSFQKYGNANYTYTRQTLANYGYDENHKLVLDLYYESSGHYPHSEAQATVYKNSLEGSGVITVKLHALEWAQYRQARNAGTMPLMIYGWYPDYIDPDNYAFLPFAGWLNMGYNKTYPAGGVAQYALWLAGRSSTESADRQAAYYALQDLQADECSIVPLWQGKTTAASKANIGGIVLDITVQFRYWLLYWES